MGAAGLTAADRAAVERVLESRPAWSAVRRVADVVGRGRRVLLHAGPPFSTVAEIPPPLRNSLAFACVYEGWAEGPVDATEALASGAVEVLAAQDHAIVVPLAGVASPSMALAEAADGRGGRAFAVLNEGQECASRLGVADERLPAHHRWLNGELAAWLAEPLREPLPLLPLLRASLEAGDDGHSRTSAGSRLVTEALLERANGAVPERVASFLHGAAAFALNLWMAATACALSAADGVEGARIVTRAAGNGRRFGLQLADVPGAWITSDAPVPQGAIEPRHAGRRALGAIGDSALVDLFGLGGQIREQEPAARVLCAAHPELGGRAVVTSARRAVAAGHGPRVLLGMIDATGTAGRIGGGVVETPLELLR